MFFFVFFGTYNKKRIIKQFENLYCPECGVKKEAQLISLDMVFHIFFIPIFKIRSQYFLIFKSCNHDFKIEKEKAESIPEDFNEDKFNTKEELKFDYKYCKKCDRTFDESYNYCPYCGGKLE